MRQSVLARQVRSHANQTVRLCLVTIVLVATLASCAESVQHDEVRAAKQALEFSRILFFEKDLDKAYDLLADGGKRHVPREKFKQSIAAMHPRNYPTKVTAIEYEPMADEKAIYIFLTGQNNDDQFNYRVTMEGTAASGYKVLKIDRGTGFFALASKKQAFKPPLTAE